MPGPMREVPFTVLRGFFMGAADVVPGVSGGTVALVFAIYHRLIEAVRTGSNSLGRFARLDVRAGLDELKRVEWMFLVPLLVGIGLAVLSLSSLLKHLLEDRPVEMAGLFLGLVGGSVIVAWQLLRRRDGARILVLLAVGVVTFLLLGLREGTTEATVETVSNPSLLAFFGAGAIAICAMILPGVSGSFLLVTMGMYGSVLAAVTDRDLLSLGVFLAGCVLGLALFSQLLHWALNTHYDTVMAGLIGLMLGSLRILWPWPRGVDSTALGAPKGPVLVPVVLCVVGLTVVVAVNEVAKRLEHRSTEDEASELRAS
jgi:putative membrane protein